MSDQQPQPVTQPAKPADSGSRTLGLVFLGVVGVVVLIAIVAAFAGNGKPPASAPKAAAVEAEYTPAKRDVQLRFDGTTTGVDITMSFDGEMSQHRGKAVPLTSKDGSEGINLKLRPGTRIYWSGQNTKGHGTLSCAIVVDGVTIDENLSSGGYVITTCKAVVP